MFLLVRLQFVNLLLQVDDIERQFFDFLEQEFVHLAHVHTVFLNLGAGQTMQDAAMNNAKKIFFLIVVMLFVGFVVYYCLMNFAVREPVVVVISNR